MRARLLATLAVVSVILPFHSGVASADDKVERGRYLVNFGGCFDCHTPGYFFGKPDMTKFLAGSDVGFEIPEMGVFYGPNLTPDPETGLGNWTEDEIVTALQTGARPDGRQLAPIMPWRSFAKLTRDDAQGDRRLSEKLAAGEEQGSWTIRARREADVVRHEDRGAIGPARFSAVQKA